MEILIHLCLIMDLLRTPEACIIWEGCFRRIWYGCFCGLLESFI